MVHSVSKFSWQSIKVEGEVEMGLEDIVLE